MDLPLKMRIASGMFFLGELFGKLLWGKRGSDFTTRTSHARWLLIKNARLSLMFLSGFPKSQSKKMESIP
jgi:hypothetical protein